MLNKKIIYITVIIASTLLITYFHLWLFRGPAPYIVLEELYYIPLLLAAFMFGLKGTLLTYFFVSILYLPFLFGQWTATVLSLIDRILHLFFTGIFVLLAGLLIDRERRREHQLEKDRYLTGLGQVAAAIVHDLKNPLISILGFAKRIREGKGDVSAAAEVIEDSAQNMQRIVDGVLDFAKPIRLELKKEDIHRVIQRACDSCKIKAEESEVILSVDVPTDPVNIEIDSFNLQRAIINLINNAIEASPKGQHVIIRTETEKNHVGVRVEDFGSGMDRETLENIFVPFYSKKNRGSGLGMAIVKKIVDGHDGKIQVKSQPGLGTEVMIELPYQPPMDLEIQKKEDEI
jgi:signal transduction histidine kinase